MSRFVLVSASDLDPCKGSIENMDGFLSIVAGTSKAVDVGVGVDVHVCWGVDIGFIIYGFVALNNECCWFPFKETTELGDEILAEVFCELSKLRMFCEQLDMFLYRLLFVMIDCCMCCNEKCLISSHVVIENAQRAMLNGFLIKLIELFSF